MVWKEKKEIMAAQYTTIQYGSNMQNLNHLITFCVFRAKMQDLANNCKKIITFIITVLITAVYPGSEQIKSKIILKPTGGRLVCYGYATVAQLNNQHNPRVV